MNVINLCDDEADNCSGSDDETYYQWKMKSVTEVTVQKPPESRRINNRRKSELQPMKNNEIEIIEDGEAKEIPYVVARNPNLNLMQTLATLRGKIQLEMTKRGLSPITFTLEQTSDQLIEEYDRKIKEKKK